MRTLRIKRGLQLVCVVFISRFLISCFGCDCPAPNIIGLNFSKSSIQPFDNSEGYIWYESFTDTISKAAIGFEITLSDSALGAEDDYYYLLNKQSGNSGFNQANAMSDCECDYYDFKPSAYLSGIHVRTLFRFNEKYQMGTDITDIILGDMEYGASSKGLYIELSDVIDYFNSFEVYDIAEINFQLFLKEACDNDSLQLVFNFEFDNNSGFSDTTSVIYMAD